MKRRVFSWGVLLAAFVLVLFAAQGAGAQTDDQTGRHKTVEIQALQYVWELVSNRDGRILCEIVVEYPNRPTYQDTVTLCAEQIFPPEATPAPTGQQAGAQPTPEPFDLAQFFATVTYRFVTTRELIRTVEVPVPDMIVNMIVPPSRTGQFFVSVYAYEPVLSESITEIRGVLNGWAFSCPSSRCDIPITSDSILEFWAVSSYGDESQHVQATLRVLSTDQGRRIEVSSLVPIVLFQDSCSDIWGLPRYQVPEWSELPPLPEDLNTMKPYQYLAGQLIHTGVVDAQDCPGGGLLAPGGAPNSCGLDRASQAVIEWQNQYDLVIWSAARQYGIPPRLIKTLIEQESQFWPSNGRRYIFEYGLGQMSQAGADVALRWDNDLFETVCNGLLYDCSIAYGRLPSWVQAQLRGGFMNALNSECATCPRGIDLQKAHESIPILTRSLQANCRQVKYIMDRQGLTANYEDFWKMTLISYHSGYECLNSALTYLKYNRLTPEWENLVGFLSCPGSQLYINDFWKSLQEFDQFRYIRPDRDLLVSQPVFAATPTPTRTPAPTVTPTVVTSMARIRVMVYVDSNRNNYPDESEKVNNIAVQAQFRDGSLETALTAKGEAVFNLSGRPVGGDVVVSLPDLFRSQKVRVIQDGEIPVIFRLEEPVVPPVLP